VTKHISEDHPDFKVRIICTGLKLLGKQSTIKTLQEFKHLKSTSSLIAGLDLINNEDLSSPLLEFVPDIV